MDFDLVLFILEMVGTVAFAISGVAVAKERKMDVFGACLLGCTTACGGGVVRDIILGMNPPRMFVRPIYVEVALITSLLMFFYEYYKQKREKRDIIDENPITTEHVLSIADAIGLAAFVVVGYQSSINAGYYNGFLGTFVGVCTGIGGGLIRDLLAGQMPVILSKRVYGLAAILGGVTYYLTTQVLDTTQIIASALSMAVTIIIRILAIERRWDLPKLK